MKIKVFLFAFAALLAVNGNASAQTIGQNDKILVAYFSHSGNTAEVAKQIHQQVGGDIFEIVPVNDYPENYREITDQAKKEIAAGYKPELKNKVNNLGSYDVIFVGSPCWWGTIASPVSSFLNSGDLAGKKIILFMTHGGSGFGHSLTDVREMLPNSTVIAGQAFRGSNVKESKQQVADWLKGLQND